ncbi:hypothetical protein [Halocatena marina]|uniref:Uncharacterized protein n=1 Tax=Halocatena marina TaxID=2934937 RepID=A0ABD5YNE9_9EURY|nr:hypothetical protein [Halocatena marina]
MVNASKTENTLETDGQSGFRIKRLLTGVVGKTLLLIVGLLVFGTLVDAATPDTAMMSVIVGMSYSLAGVIVLVGAIVAVVLAIK